MGSLDTVQEMRTFDTAIKLLTAKSHEITQKHNAPSPAPSRRVPRGQGDPDPFGSDLRASPRSLLDPGPMSVVNSTWILCTTKCALVIDDVTLRTQLSQGWHTTIGHKRRRQRWKADGGGEGWMTALKAICNGMKAIYNGESDSLGGDDGRRRATICKGGQQRVENVAYGWKHDGKHTKGDDLQKVGVGDSIQGHLFFGGYDGLKRTCYLKCYSVLRRWSTGNSNFASVTLTCMELMKIIIVEYFWILILSKGMLVLDSCPIGQYEIPEHKVYSATKHQRVVGAYARGTSSLTVFGWEQYMMDDPVQFPFRLTLTSKMAFATSSFWGPVTSTTEWCEQNYVYSSYIAEFYNTISNIPSIILALIGLVIALSQRFEKRFSILHISNMILAIGSMLFHSTLQRLQQQGDETPMVWEMLLYIYILYSPDWHYKSTMPIFLFLYGHALWHLLIAFNSFFANEFLMFCRAQQRGWNPRIEHFSGFLPYVRILKPKAD
ncbi:hypothetical protein E3N88_15033 [Mikania micrantha]|uniref:Uncharacterized protein n=1 Tax=Mikania micrantha TaxID=192012 RepID=A0A5N6P545_9ASTR|nr:hypothetical protein E3N88_15033 [Mikania micrantha]